MSPEPPRTVVDFPKIPQLPKIPASGIRAVALVVIAALVLFSLIYTVAPQEEGVILRFGKYSRTSGPGLHFKLPLAIERVIKVPVQRQLKQEFGFRTVRAGVQSESARGRDELRQSNMLTGDLNAAVVEWVVQYRVDDAREYLFKVRSVESTLRHMSEAIMRQVVGDRTVDEVLTIGRQQVADLVEERLQVLCDQYENGIRIEQVVLQGVNPPPEVQGSFNEVNQSEQERETKINQAQQQYNEIIFRARGEALQTVSNAEGYALDRVNRSQGEAARFQSLYAEYRKAPEVTRTRIYLETMTDILPKMGGKTILDGDLEGVLPLLEIQGAAAGAAAVGRRED